MRIRLRYQPAVEAPDLKVGNWVDLTGASFKGKAIFSGAKIGGLFDASMARFESENGVDFSGMKVGHFHADVKPGAFLEGVQLRGPVSFAGGQFYDLTITGPADPRPNLSSLNLEQVTVERNLEIHNISMGELAADSLRVKGEAILAGLEIKDKVDLGSANFTCLKMSDMKWPTPGKERVRFGGMTYQSIEIADDPPGTRLAQLIAWLFPTSPILERVDNSAFDAGNYLQVQNFFQRTAKEELGDQAYINLRRRSSGLESPGDWLKPWYWPQLLFWDLPVGYGRKPLRILWYALIFVVAGALFFDPRYLTGVSWPERSRLYDVLGRLALSFDMFTPSLLNLGYEQNWHPVEVSVRLKTFIFFHKLVGRIFIAVFFLGVWAKFK